MTDAITVLRTRDGRPCNKLYVRNADGAVEKTKAREGGSFVALTVPIRDLAALAGVLQDVGQRPDHMIMLAVAIGAPSGEYNIIAQEGMARHLGCEKHERAKLVGWHEINGRPTCCRLKENYAKSTILLIDRDNAPGTPVDVADLTTLEYLEALNLVMPGIAECGRLVVPSSSTRVLIDGVPGKSSNAHIYVQTTSDADCEARWDNAVLRSRITTYPHWLGDLELAFAKPIHQDGMVDHHICWPIFDPTVIGRERLVFEGSPKVVGTGLEIAESTLVLIDGTRVNLDLIKDLTAREVIEIKAASQRITGRRVTFDIERNGRVGRDGKPSVSGITEIMYDLNLDMPLEREDGAWTTYGDLLKGPEVHVRLQTPWRSDSRSSAAWFSKEYGQPFLMDIADRIRHVLDRDLLPRTTTDVCKAWATTTLRPSYVTLDGRVFCEQADRPLKLVKVGVTSDLLKEVRLASNAPLLKGGAVDENRLPGHAKKWLEVAWNDIKQELPKRAAAEHAAEAFKKQIGALLKHRTWGEGATCAGWTGGQRALGTWTHYATELAVANKCGVRRARFGSFDIMGIIDTKGFRVALRPSLAGQLSKATHSEIDEMTPEKFSRHCAACGIRDDTTENIFDDGGKRERWTILTAEFIESLDLAIDHRDPQAEAVKETVTEFGLSEEKGYFKNKKYEN
jgi:hypothetical protein